MIAILRQHVQEWTEDQGAEGGREGGERGGVPGFICGGRGQLLLDLSGSGT